MFLMIQFCKFAEIFGIRKVINRSMIGFYPNFINLGKVTLSIRQALSSARYLENSHWYYQRIRATVWQKQTNILK